MQHWRAALHLSFLSHLQITAALLTESKSKSNFPSWKCFSIDPHPELIGFMSLLRRNQITAENVCARAGVYCVVGVCLNGGAHLCACLRTWMCLFICASRLFRCRNQWTVRWPSPCNTLFLPPLIKVKRCNVEYKQNTRKQLILPVSLWCGPQCCLRTYKGQMSLNPKASLQV